MKTHRLLSFLLAGVFCFVAGVREAQAVILVYKVTASVRALNFPKTSSAVAGYLFFDTTNSANSITVETFRNKTYTVNGLLFTLLTPANFQLTPLDRNNDSFPDTVAPLITVNSQTFTDARAILGAVPKTGFKLGRNPPILFTGVAKVLRGYGSRVVNGSDLLTRSDVYVIDALTGAQPATTAVARDNIIGRLANLGYKQAP